MILCLSVCTIKPSTVNFGAFIECNIGGLFVNVLVYADDMVLLSQSWHAMQELIKILEYCCIKLDIVGNTKKTVCIIFRPRNKENWIGDNFSDFSFDG